MDVTPATPRPRTTLGDRLAREPRMLPEDARRSNRGLILRALHHGGPASRADLAKLVGLTPATVSAVIKELLDAGPGRRARAAPAAASASRRRWSASSPTPATS